MNNAGTRLIEQKITKQVTVSNGASGSVSIAIPQNRKAFLKGYGYTWYTSTTYQLSAGTFTFPSRTDAEGTPAIPMQWSQPFPIDSSKSLTLNITNADSSSHTYTVVFYLLVDAVLDISSAGGDLVVTTGGSSGSGNNVAIYDSTFASVAPVDSTLGLTVNDKSPATLLDGTKTTSSASAVAIAASTACRYVIITADVANADYVLVGNATSQSQRLDPGDSITVLIANLATVFVKRPASTNVTVNFTGA